MDENARLTELRARMTGAGIDAAILLHHRDIFYYVGVVRPAALLVAPHDARLLVRRGLEHARRDCEIAHAALPLAPMRGFSDVAAALAEMGLGGGVMGTELDLIPAQIYRRLQEVFPRWELADITPCVLAQRLVKSEKEIAAVRRAGGVADVGQAAAPRFIAPGMSELELAAEVEAAIRRAGHEGFQPLRYPEARGGGILLMSGEHLTVRGGHGLVVTGAGLSPAMPYGPSWRRLQAGDLVVVDIGATYAGYTADESRTFVVGRASAAQKALAEAACAVEDAVFAALRPGVRVAEVYAAAEAVAARGAPPYFPPGGLLLPGFVGHGVGVELDEPPVLWPREEMRLQAGMTLAVEVELSAPAHGWMVKVEDTVVLREDGCESLTFTPRFLSDTE